MLFRRVYIRHTEMQHGGVIQISLSSDAPAASVTLQALIISAVTKSGAPRQRRTKNYLLQYFFSNHDSFLYGAGRLLKNANETDILGQLWQQEVEL
ncbi:hypothetical protein NPIL_587831 [Nephila pilipes]|uniref:Uncharacterized protein n=1 Tax=Nephila pilipes TaxID=299642 RepID=A0A8X6UD86_NEPPI|nr:hypothetical protein NPIL_587831 [Nephila pilipes]